MINIYKMNKIMHQHYQICHKIINNLEVLLCQITVKHQYIYNHHNLF